MPKPLRGHPAYAPFAASTGWQAIVSLLAIVVIFLHIALLMLWGTMATTIMTMKPGRGSDQAVREVRSNATMSFLASGALVLCSVVFGLAFLAWIYLRYKNLPALRATKTQFQPWEALVALLIPLINFFLLLPIMLDLWKGSDPGSIPLTRSPLPPSRPTIVQVWWTLGLFNLILSGVIFAISGAKTQPELVRLSFVCIGAAALGIVQSMAFFLMVSKIAANQEKRYHIVVQSEPDLPATAVVSVPAFPDDFAVPPSEEPRP